MMDYLTKRPFEGFLCFCQSLVDTSQKHIVLNYLTPEIPQLVEPMICEETDAIPADVQALLPSIVVFDWRKRVRDNLVKLTFAIDPDSGLLLELNRLGVINEWTIDTFQVWVACQGFCTCPQTSVHTNLIFTMMQPTSNYKQLCKSSPSKVDISCTLYQPLLLL